MSNAVQFNINIQSNGTTVLNNIDTALGNVALRTRSVNSGFSDCLGKLFTMNQSLQGLQNLKSAIDDTIAPGVKLNSSMKDLSAITGVTGEKLKEIEANARASAKVFGTDAAQNAESYKLVLSQLDPTIAENSEALKLMGDHINVLSKTMGGDTVAATNVLTTAMNQFGVSTKDPLAASKKMAEMMNVMAAAAKEGSAELPQIKNALEQSGMVAKTANVSFEELNAGIQVLDKAGKKGAEGGVAIRNVLTELSLGEHIQHRAKKILDEYGISAKALGDNTKTMSERLQMLKPMMNDTAAMTMLFGKENMAAGIALVKGTDEVDRYTKAIQGTNVAQEQADIVMTSYQERMNRFKAKMDDVKISIFNATQSYLPYIQNTLSATEQVGKMATGLTAIDTLFKSEGIKKFGTAVKELSVFKSVAATVTSVYNKALNGMRNATIQSTIAQIQLNLAMLANPVGLIIAGILLVVGVFVYLWETSRKFREILFGIWEAAKAVFTNIGIVVMRIWNLVIKPYFEMMWNIAKAVWTGIYNAVKWVIESIIACFKFMWDLTVKIWTSIYNTVAAVFSWIWDIIKSVGEAIGNFFGGIWNFIKGLLGSVGSFLNEWIVQPIKNAFGGVWDFVTGIFSKIWDGLKRLFKPIIDLWNKIFSSEGMVSVSGSFDVGVKKGGESFDKDKKEKEDKKNKTTAQTAIDMKSMTAGLGATGGAGMAGGGGVKPKGTGGEGGGKVGSSNTNINVTIHKLQDQTVIHTTNVEMGTAEAGKKTVDNLLIALQGITGQSAA